MKDRESRPAVIHTRHRGFADAVVSSTRWPDRGGSPAARLASRPERRWDHLVGRFCSVVVNDTRL